MLQIRNKTPQMFCVLCEILNYLNMSLNAEVKSDVFCFRKRQKFARIGNLVQMTTLE
jgi:hypothetical protein